MSLVLTKNEVYFMTIMAKHDMNAKRWSFTSEEHHTWARRRARVFGNLIKKKLVESYTLTEGKNGEVIYYRLTEYGKEVMGIS